MMSYPRDRRSHDYGQEEDYKSRRKTFHYPDYQHQSRHGHKRDHYDFHNRDRDRYPKMHNQDGHRHEHN